MDRLEKNNIVKEVQDSFLEYSMSVIVARALPDLRDGLKPVHRRILYFYHVLYRKVVAEQHIHVLLQQLV